MSSLSLHSIGHGLPAEVQLWWLELEPGASPLEASRETRKGLVEALSRMLGRTVSESEIVAESRGKPRLVTEPGSMPGLGFNISHSGSEALIGVATSAAIGVDLEQLRPVPEAEAFVKEYLTDGEREGWLRQPPDSRDRWLLDCWTRKEACLKATGDGLARAPNSLEVGPGPELVRISLDSGYPRTCVEVCSVILPTGTPAAAAIVSPDSE
jgi:phosphopantetheine--protein transferase-like protein